MSVIFSYDFDLDTISDDNQTLLGILVGEKNLPILEILLSGRKKPDMYQTSSRQKLPIVTALYSGDEKIIELFCQYGFDPNKTLTFTARGGKVQRSFLTVMEKFFNTTDAKRIQFLSRLTRIKHAPKIVEKAKQLLAAHENKNRKTQKQHIISAKVNKNSKNQIKDTQSLTATIPQQEPKTQEASSTWFGLLVTAVTGIAMIGGGIFMGRRYRSKALPIRQAAPDNPQDLRVAEQPVLPSAPIPAAKELPPKLEAVEEEKAVPKKKKRNKKAKEPKLEASVSSPAASVAKMAQELMQPKLVELKDLEERKEGMPAAQLLKQFGIHKPESRAVARPVSPVLLQIEGEPNSGPEGLLAEEEVQQEGREIAACPPGGIPVFH